MDSNHYGTEPMDVVQAQKAIHYDGTNSADIAARIPDFTVTDETATTLTFTSGGQSRTVARGGFIGWAAGVVTDVYNNADDFRDARTPVSTADHVHDVVLTSGGAKPAPENA